MTTSLSFSNLEFYHLVWLYVFLEHSLFKNFKGDQNIKLLGAAWLFLGATLILYYVRSIL